MIAYQLGSFNTFFPLKLIILGDDIKFPCALLKILFHELYNISPLKLIIGNSLSSGLKIESRF